MTANRLATAASAYLQSAAHQPIHWYPWGAEAFAAARSQDRPVLLDIGAVWCHWCHVMDGESYEDPALAAFPQRPLRLHQGGPGRAARCGRPLPARGPGAHPPGRMAAHGVPHPRGRGVLRRHLLPARREVRPARASGPCWRSVLDAYRSRRDQVRGAGPGDPSRARRAPRREPRRASRRPALLDDARRSDRPRVRSGQRRVRQPAEISPPGARSPSCSIAGTTSRGERPARIIDRTLEGMARGGMHDQLGGGFHRYSVDAEVDRAALREDVVRQLRAAEGVSRRLRAVRHRGVRRRGAGHRALGARGGWPIRRRATPPARTPTSDWTTTATTSPGPGTRPRRCSRATSWRSPRRTTISAPPGRCTMTRQERALRRGEPCRRSPGSPGSTEEAARRCSIAAREQAAGGPCAPSRAVRGPHPLHQLERDDGLGHAPRRRGAGR